MTEPPYDPYASGYPQDPHQYPDPSGWANQPPPPPPAPGFAARLGPRSRRRPDLRIGGTLAGAGAVLAMVGAVVVAGGYYAHGDNGRRFLGALLFAAVAAGGYALAISRRTGGLATAGAVAAAFSVPLCLAFVSLDPTSLLSSGYPFNVDLVFLLSIAVWLVTYLVVPGLRGRALFLGAAAFWLFGYVALKASDYSGFASVTSSLLGGRGGGETDTGTVTAIGLIFGLAYYALAAVLDARGRSGAAVALVLAAFDATVSGIAAGASDMGQAGTGALLIVLGLLLSAYGARFGRRFTAWAWAAGFVLGCGLVVQDVADTSYLGNGLTLMVIGVAVVAAAHALGTALREAPEIETDAVEGAGPAVHPAG
jgi:hypothetical protein